MLSGISGWCDHGVLRLHSRGFTSGSRAAAAPVAQRSGKGEPRSVDWLSVQSGRGSAAAGGGFGVQSESRFGELSERPAQQVERRASRRVTWIRSGCKAQAIFEVAQRIGYSRSRRRVSALHRDSLHYRRRIAGIRERERWRRRERLMSTGSGLALSA